MISKLKTSYATEVDMKELRTIQLWEGVAVQDAAWGQIGTCKHTYVGEVGVTYRVRPTSMVNNFYSSDALPSYGVEVELHTDFGEKFTLSFLEASNVDYEWIRGLFGYFNDEMELRDDVDEEDVRRVLPMVGLTGFDDQGSWMLYAVGGNEVWSYGDPYLELFYSTDFEDMDYGYDPEEEWFENYQYEEALNA